MHTTSAACCAVVVNHSPFLPLQAGAIQILWAIWWLEVLYGNNGGARFGRIALVVLATVVRWCVGCW